MAQAALSAVQMAHLPNKTLTFVQRVTQSVSSVLAYLQPNVYNAAPPIY